MANGERTMLVFLDIKNVSDNIEHSLLLIKLEAIGVQGGAIEHL